ncbi:uncharacterized protein [Rutidosis leptorrhynchoides]|uniref:uncharacterized protein n=1 Tax=Rutidosis leptorrhynchoides TaxID=125765 RepID=UPI003A9A36D1
MTRVRHFGAGITEKAPQLDILGPDAIDVIRNGVNQYDPRSTFKICEQHLSSRVGRFNLDSTGPDQFFEKSPFLLLMFFLWSSVCFHVSSWIPTSSIIMAYLATRTDIDSSDEIMVLDRSLCPVSLPIIID